MKQKITLRPITTADHPFLEELYASTRREEVAQTPWNEAEKANFLQWQFEAQHKHYMEHYAQAQFDVILKGKRPIGRLYVDRWQDEIRIVDIALLPKYRGHGIGSKFLKSLMAEAQQAQVPLSIHVEQNNLALRLYERLGFEHVDTNGVYHLMRWKAE